MSDRRGRARTFYSAQQGSLPENTDYYLTRGGIYSDGYNRPDFRRMSDLFYVDNIERYQPIYRDDRVFRSEPRTYYTSAAHRQEYVAIPPTSQSQINTADNEN
ncbi:uncharacterized protein isoform X2 [Rhodnius prolixus]|uniref:Uncharacterized protein n=2 Tax=Rhodnius prolixus TaxID=13249 RepID=T1I5N0_RHOPR